MPHYAFPPQSRREANRQYIGEALSKGIASVAEGYIEGQQRKMDEEIFEKMQDPNLSSLQKAQLAAKLSLKSQKALSHVMELENKFAREKDVATRHEQDFSLKEEREKRLQKQNEVKGLERLYRGRQTDLQEQIKDSSERNKPALRQEQNLLQKELSQNLIRLKKGQRPESRFFDFGNGEEAQPQEMSQMEAKNLTQGSAGMSQPQPQAQPQQKLKWDPRNPEHAAFAQEAARVAGGDRAKANAIISERFQR